MTKRRRDLPPKYLKLLGVIPDAQLAIRSGETIASIRRRRVELKLPPAPRYNYPIEERFLPMLGKIGDSEFARLAGVPVSAVIHRRNKIGIPAVHAPRGRKKVTLDPSYFSMLGKISDVAIGEMSGVSRFIVARVRKELRVSPEPGVRFGGRSLTVLPPHLIAKLGKESDLSLAEEAGVGPNIIARSRRERGIPMARSSAAAQSIEPFKHLLGKSTDAELGREHGVPFSTIKLMRNRLGIAPAIAPNPPVRLSATLIKKLGKEPDRAIAAAVGCSPSVIARHRNALGLPTASLRLVIPSRVVKLLGKQPDGVLAVMACVSPGTIRRHRQDLGIPSFVTPATKLAPSVVKMLGTRSDAVLAKRAGVGFSIIRNARLQRGIPSWARRSASK